MKKGICSQLMPNSAVTSSSVNLAHVYRNLPKVQPEFSNMCSTLTSTQAVVRYIFIPLNYLSSLHGFFKSDNEMALL